MGEPNQEVPVHRMWCKSWGACTGPVAPARPKNTKSRIIVDVGRTFRMGFPLSVKGQRRRGAVVLRKYRACNRMHASRGRLEPHPKINPQAPRAAAGRAGGLYFSDRINRILDVSLPTFFLPPFLAYVIYYRIYEHHFTPECYIYYTLPATWRTSAGKRITARKIKRNSIAKSIVGAILSGTFSACIRL